MTTLSIKDVPEAWAELLRNRAERNHRSLQGELMALIEAAVIDSQATTVSRQVHAPNEVAPIGAVKKLKKLESRGQLTTDQIIAARALRDKTVNYKTPSSTDWIRQDRDTR